MNNNLGENLLRFNKNQKYVVFDVETEGLNLYFNNKPWQASIIVTTLDETIAEHNLYLKWDKINVSEGARRITGFEQSVVDKKGISPIEGLEILEKYLYDPQYKILWFNGINFDVYMHNIWRKLLGRESDYSYMERTIDVNCLAKAYKLGVDFDSEKDEFVPWQYKLGGFRQRGLKSNLTYMCKDLEIGIDESKTHEALYDCELTFEVFKKLIWNLSI